MKHIDEKILELYLLGSDKVKDRRTEIESHIKECADCNDLFLEMKEFYEAADNALDRNSNKQLADGAVNLVPRYGNYNPVEVESKYGIIDRITSVIRKYPIASGAGMIAAAVVITLMFTKGVTNSEVDNNLSYVITNDSSKALEIYNTDHDKLWEIKWATNREINFTESAFNISYTSITDINNDGMNDLITDIPFLAGDNQKDVVIFMNNEKETLQKISIGSDINYYDKFYPAKFETRGIITNDYDGDGLNEIISGAYHYNSPYVVSRIDNNGEIIGEYWHYGHLWGIHEIDLYNDGKKELLLCGQNDDLKKPVLAIIDPARLKGKLQSKYSPGFGLNNSSAETVYITFDKSELETTFKGDKRRFIRLYNETDNELSIVFAFYVNEFQYELMFVFDKQMRIVRIYPTDTVKRNFEKLRSEKKVSFNIDDNYFEKLKNNLTYLTPNTPK